MLGGGGIGVGGFFLVSFLGVFISLYTPQVCRESDRNNLWRVDLPSAEKCLLKKKIRS